MQRFNFTKSFLGANGISTTVGFTTPDTEEAAMKTEAAKRSMITIVLADHTKFSKVFSVTFAELRSTCIITDRLADKSFKDITVVKEVLV